MDMTIFSRSIGVICFSHARLLFSVDSSRVSSGRACGSTEDEVSSKSSDAADSRLEDSSGMSDMGMSAVFGLLEKDERGSSPTRACMSGWQQNVSLFHNRHDRFSNRLPSATALDVLEKSDHIPKRFSTLRVSIVCNAGTSTRNSECSGLNGILAVVNGGEEYDVVKVLTTFAVANVTSVHSSARLYPAAKYVPYAG